MNKVIDAVDIAAGARLRARRQELGLTLEGVAEALAVSGQQVGKYESGVNRLSPARILLLSRLLKVEPSYFFEVDLRQNVRILSNEDLIIALSGDEDCSRLNKAFKKIASSTVREKVVALVLAVAASTDKAAALSEVLEEPTSKP